MAPPPSARRHLPTSPFAERPPTVLEHYEVDDRVNHDQHGLGRVVSIESAAVLSVKFSQGVLRLPNDRKLSKL